MITRYLWKLFIMKQLMIIVLMLLLFACSNKKAEIVEQIKSYKDSLTEVAKAQTDLRIEQNKLLQKYSDSLKVDFESKDLDELKKMNDQNIELQKRQLAAELELLKKQSDRKLELETNEHRFRKKIDSLELELKKY